MICSSRLHVSASGKSQVICSWPCKCIVAVHDDKGGAFSSWRHGVSRPRAFTLIAGTVFRGQIRKCSRCDTRRGLRTLERLRVAFVDQFLIQIVAIAIGIF